MTDERDAFIVWTDSALLLLGSFIVLTALLLNLINPPQKKSQDEATPVGNIIVHIRWPDGIDADVDLWIRAPGDIPVGYSSKQGRYFNLLRDSLGTSNNLGGLREEFAFSNGVPPGEYCSTAGLYRIADGSLLPVTVTYDISLRGDSVSDITNGSIQLTRVGEERTLACFTIDDRKLVVPGSLNTVERHIWRAP